MSFVIYLIAFASTIQFILSQTPQQDLVQDFPGYGQYNYDIYSGMLNITTDGSRQIHYVLLESQNDPLKDPFAIWLNGGPGCSSMQGLFQENGPFLLQGNNFQFIPNPDFTWNKNYNVLYLEGPPGVGYSMNYDSSYQYTEDNSGNDFLQAYIQFRQRFNSKLNVDNDLWITGESYGGMYIPYFSKHILNYNKQNPNNAIPLKGFMISNGITMIEHNLSEHFKQQTYVDNHFFNWELQQGFYDCQKYGTLSEKCRNFKSVYPNIVNNTNHFQIYNYTYSDLETNDFKEYQESGKFEIKDDRSYSPEEIITYILNKEEVKKALHVEKSHFWVGCSDEVGYKYQFGKNSNHLFSQFFKAGLRIMLISGNVDAQVPHTFTKFQIEDIRYNPEYNNSLTPKGKWRQWYCEGSKQVGGMVQYYTTNTGSEFVYAMVRSAGHQVPQYQPKASWHILDKFINNQPL